MIRMTVGELPPSGARGAHNHVWGQDGARDWASGAVSDDSLSPIPGGALRAPRGGSSPTVILIVFILAGIILVGFHPCL